MQPVSLDPCRRGLALACRAAPFSRLPLEVSPGEHPLAVLARRRLVLSALDQRGVDKCRDWADATVHASVVNRAGVVALVHDRRLDLEPALAGGVDQWQREVRLCGAARHKPHSADPMVIPRGSRSRCSGGFGAALTEYWTARRRKTPPVPIDKTSLRLLGAQDGRCPLCRDWLLPADDPPQSPREREHWLATTRRRIMRKEGTPDDTAPRRVHVHCHRRRYAEGGSDRHFCPVREPSGLA